jgi:hypothetical protein
MSNKAKVIYENVGGIELKQWLDVALHMRLLHYVNY